MMPKKVNADTWPLAHQDRERHQALKNAFGNLVLLEASLNRSIQDKAWEEKKPAYVSSMLKSSSEIQDKATWTFEDIKTRSENSWEKILGKLSGYIE